MKKKQILKLVPLFATVLTSCGTKTYEVKDYMLEMEWKDDFRILQLNDIHLSIKDDQEYHQKFIDLTINDTNANPDLIVLNGDTFTFADKTTVKRTFKWLDSHKIPWTITFGNHDEQGCYSIDWLTGYLNKLSNSSDSYCIFKDIQDDDLTGNCNFVINLKQGNIVKEQIVFIDSNRYNLGKYKDYEAYVGYDAIHEEQIDWYENVIKYTKEQNSGTIVPSVAFFHIPLPEFGEAYLDETTTKIYEQNESPLETSCPPDINTGLFDKMVELGSTNGVFCAHDHYNNYAVEYKGITLSYGVNSDNRIYSDDHSMGGQVIEIKNDGTFDITHIFHTYKELD